MSARKSHGRFRDDINRNALIRHTLIYLRIDFTCEFLEYARNHGVMTIFLVIHFLIFLKFFFTESRYFAAFRQLFEVLACIAF